VCLWLCTASVHNTTKNSSDNLPSYLQTNIIAQMLSIGGEGVSMSSQLSKWINWMKRVKQNNEGNTTHTLAGSSTHSHCEERRRLVRWYICATNTQHSSHVTYQLRLYFIGCQSRQTSFTLITSLFSHTSVFSIKFPQQNSSQFLLQLLTSTVQLISTD